MSVGFECGAVYRPRFAMAGRPVPSPDEDEFTVAVGAWEALALPPGAPRPTHLDLAGEIPPSLHWAFLAYLGGPADVHHHRGDSAELDEAIAAVSATGEGVTSLVLAVEPAGTGGAVAVALRFGPNSERRSPRWTPRPGSVGGAERVAAALVEFGAVAATGTAAPREEPPWPLERAHQFSTVPPSQVAEGAYVPRARYLENLPSRWRLEADRCGRCGRVTFPRRGRCRYCGPAGQLSPEILPRDGAIVVAATVIGKGGQPTEFDPQVDALGSYGVVLAEFAPGVRLTLQVTDSAPGGVRIGDRVGTRLRRLYPMEGEWRYGRKAVPISP